MPRFSAAELWSRRQFMIASAIAGLPIFQHPASAFVRRSGPFKDYPFQLGVTSGDPTPDAVVLWTRLAPEPLTGGGMPNENFAVDWSVADDEKFSRVVRQGTATATPELAHSVHFEVEGLRPDRWYFYRFSVAGETSPIGRTRTAPAPDAMPDRLRLAFASCQHYEQGLFTAYEHMAAEPLDLIFHLGDYTYEYPGKANLVRRHVGDAETVTLDDYRNRLGQYKSDPFLRAAHAACPWIVTWDDHEFDNDYANLASEEPNIDPQAFALRRAAAYQAYYEHMPLRRAQLPVGPDMQLYRKLSFGRLAQFDVLDTRQYRTKQPCGGRGRTPPCDDVFNPQATILGDKQEAWMCEQLTNSPATWNVLAQQVMMGRVDRQPGDVIGYSMDQWPGYEVNRRRMLKFLAEQKIANPIVLTGDIHENWVNDLKLESDGSVTLVVATEFVGTSISSGGDGNERSKDYDAVLRENPFIKFYNSERGYVSCEVTPREWRSHYRVVEYVTRPGAPRVTRASFAVEAGRPGAERI